MLYGASITFLVLLFVFYACKKEGASDLSVTEPSNNTTSVPTGLARGTGTETVFSTDSAGVVYKMVLTWNSSGVVTVDRSVVTTGYPTDIHEFYYVEDGITTTTVNAGTSGGKDTIKLTLEPGTTYYLINFMPTTSGGYQVYSYPSGGNANLCCCDIQCSGTAGGWGSKCEKKTNKKGTYCAGCRSCGIESCIYDPASGLDTPVRIPSGGVYLVEATGITIIH